MQTRVREVSVPLKIAHKLSLTLICRVQYKCPIKTFNRFRNRNRENISAIFA